MRKPEDQLSPGERHRLLRDFLADPANKIDPELQRHADDMANWIAINFGMHAIDMGVHSPGRWVELSPPLGASPFEERSDDEKHSMRLTVHYEATIDCREDIPSRVISELRRLAWVLADAATTLVSSEVENDDERAA